MITRNHQSGIDKYKFSLSVLFGILCFVLNIHPLNINISPYDIPLYIGLFLPVYIAILWGWKFGLLSALSGGYLSIFIFWDPEGYGTVYAFILYLLWVLWHGFGEKFSKETGETIWTNTIVLEILFRFFMILSTLTIYPLILSFNPPFWNSSIHTLSMPPLQLGYFVLTQAVFGFYAILFFRVSLTNRHIRRLFRLKPLPWEKRVNSFFPTLVSFSMILWIITGLIRYSIVYSGTIPLINILLYQIYNNSLFQDIILFYVLALSFIYLEMKIREMHTQWETFRSEVNTYHKTQQQITKILDGNLSLLNELIEHTDPLGQWDFLSQALGRLEGLKKYWIVALSPDQKSPVFMTPNTDKEKREILYYLNSKEGRSYLWKLKKSHDITVEPAVTVNQRELFPDIYHVLISAFISRPDGEYLIGFIVEEDLVVSRLFSDLLRFLIKILRKNTGKKDEQLQTAAVISKQQRSKIMQAHYTRLPGYWIIIDSAYQIKVISEDFLHFSGYTRTDILGHDLRRILNIPEKYELTGGTETATPGFLVRNNGSQTPILVTQTSLSAKITPDFLIHLSDNLSGYLKLKAFEDREFRYRSYFNNMSDASFVIDRTTRIIDVNQTACALFKYHRNEMIGLKVSDIVSTEEIPDIDLHMLNILKNQVSRFESIHVTKNGHKIATEVHARRFTDKNHELIHVVLRNISERKEQEKALLQFYETAKIIGDTGRTLLLGFNEQGAIRYANIRAQELSGYCENELRERYFYSVFISPDRQNDAKEFLDSLPLNKQKHGQKMFPFRAADGSEKTILWDFSHIQREKKYNIYFAIGTEITEYYKEFDYLRRERDDYKTILEKSPIPCFVTDFNGTVMMINASVSALLKKPYHEVKYQSLETCMDKIDYMRIFSGIKELSAPQSGHNRATLVSSSNNKIPVTLFSSILDAQKILFFAIPDKDL